ncbi:uncharacterized protein yc1106_03371 [Curvularia clavata]|uniref:Uncharacterized protein n=1 Tax=Curvularia clavata TaxID=95742 RepID=A0A9Q8Z5L3_CURCL|nr:uncharacterized protein yc1106_03371 [Curvularia clavata]
MNAENIIWTGDLDETPVSTSSTPAYRPPQFDANTSLTAHQKNLLIIYHLHRHYEIEFMNTVVDVDITIRRERDEPGVKFIKQQLGDMQEELARHREGGRRVERKIMNERERLGMVLKKRRGGEKEKYVARRQLEEIEKVMEKRKQKIKCLR